MLYDVTGPTIPADFIMTDIIMFLIDRLSSELAQSALAVLARGPHFNSLTRFVVGCFSHELAIQPSQPLLADLIKNSITL